MKPSDCNSGEEHIANMASSASYQTQDQPFSGDQKHKSIDYPQMRTNDSQLSSQEPFQLRKRDWNAFSESSGFPTDHNRAYSEPRYREKRTQLSESTIEDQYKSCVEDQYPHQVDLHGRLQGMHAFASNSQESSMPWHDIVNAAQHCSVGSVLLSCSASSSELSSNFQSHEHRRFCFEYDDTSAQMDEYASISGLNTYGYNQPTKITNYSLGPCLGTSFLPSSLMSLEISDYSTEFGMFVESPTHTSNLPNR